MDPTAPAPQAAEPPGATISNADLAAKLQERLEAKARRDFAASDAIRTELEQKHGIKCTDNTRSWIANDGRKGNLNGPDFFSLAGTPFAPGAAAAAVAGGGGRYDSGPPLPAGAMPTEVLFAKIAEREVSRQARDYAKSDAMRDELRRAGVNIDDKTRGWVTTDGSGRSGTISGGVARMGPPQGAQGARQPAHNAPPPHGGYGYPGHPGGYGYGAQPHGAPGAPGGAAAAWSAYYQQQQAYAAYYGQPPYGGGGGGGYPGY